MANADELKRLVKKRGNFKAQITNYRKFLDDYKTKAPDTIKLNVRLDKFKSNFVDFDQISDELEFIDENQDHSLERFEIEEGYLNLLSETLHLLEDAGISLENGTRETIRTPIVSESVTKRRIKLPQASLPKFSGKYEDWLSFKDAFTSMIHGQDDLTNVEKLQYLKSAVTGEAANKIKNLAVTDGNYERAWNLLKGSYADKRLIISRHLSLLLRLPIQERESAEGLRRLADETQQHLESLKTLDINVNEEIVVQILEEKLHKNTAEKWEETLKRDSFPRLEDMIEFLYKVASRVARRDRNRTEQTPSQNASAMKASYAGQNNSATRKSTKQVFLSKTGKPCSICQEDHPVYKCTKFRNLPVTQRIQAAKDASLCLNCLRMHGDKPCNFSKCMICSMAHNTLLHVPNEQESQSQN